MILSKTNNIKPTKIIYLVTINFMIDKFYNYIIIYTINILYHI